MPINQALVAQSLIYKFLRNSMNEINVIEDYTLGEGVFYVQPPANQQWSIRHLRVVIYSPADVIALNPYGGRDSLTAGISIQVRRGGPSGSTSIDFTDGENIKSNTDWHSIASVTDLTRWGSTFVDIDFNYNGSELVLRGSNEEAFLITVNDDFTVFQNHIFSVSGKIS